MGTKIMEQYFSENCQFDFTKEDEKLIESLIIGKKSDGVKKMKGYSEWEWVFDIVNNKWNSIDVDKFDYLWWDMKYSGMGLEF